MDIGHLHHAVFKQVGLHGAGIIQGDIVTDGNQIEFGQVGGVQEDAPADFCAHEPEEPADPRGAGEQLDKERIGEVLVEGGQQFGPPYEGAPEGFFGRDVTADEQPFGGDDKCRCDQPADQIHQRKKHCDLNDGNFYGVAQHNNFMQQQGRQRDEHRDRKQHAGELDQGPL